MKKCDNQTPTSKYGAYRNDILIKEINIFMDKNELTDIQFAKLINSKRSTVTNWRNGRQRPSDSKLDILSKVLRYIKIISKRIFYG